MSEETVRRLILQELKQLDEEINFNARSHADALEERLNYESLMTVFRREREREREERKRREKREREKHAILLMLYH
jgi:hypothetical protein